MGEEIDLRELIGKILRKAKCSLPQEQINAELAKKDIGIFGIELGQKVYVCLNTYPEFQTYDGRNYFLESYKPPASNGMKLKPKQKDLKITKFFNETDPCLEVIVDKPVKPKKKPKPKPKPVVYKPGGLRSEMYAIMAEYKIPMNDVRLVELLRSKGFPVNHSTPALIRLYFDQYPEFRKSDFHASYYVAVEKPDNDNT